MNFSFLESPQSLLALYQSVAENIGFPTGMKWMETVWKIVLPSQPSTQNRIQIS